MRMPIYALSPMLISIMRFSDLLPQAKGLTQFERPA